MMFMTTGHVLMKILACSLMLRLNQLSFMIYMAGDMTVFFGFKISMNDLRYWVNLNKVLSIVATGIIRITVKVVTDL